MAVTYTSRGYPRYDVNEAPAGHTQETALANAVNADVEAVDTAQSLIGSQCRQYLTAGNSSATTQMLPAFDAATKTTQGGLTWSTNAGGIYTPRAGMYTVAMSISFPGASNPWDGRIGVGLWNATTSSGVWDMWYGRIGGTQKATIAGIPWYFAASTLLRIQIWWISGATGIAWDTSSWMSVTYSGLG